MIAGHTMHAAARSTSWLQHVFGRVCCLQTRGLQRHTTTTREAQKPNTGCREQKDASEVWHCHTNSTTKKWHGSTATRGHNPPPPPVVS